MLSKQNTDWNYSWLAGCTPPSPEGKTSQTYLSKLLSFSRQELAWCLPPGFIDTETEETGHKRMGNETPNSFRDRVVITCASRPYSAWGRKEVSWLRPVRKCSLSSLRCSSSSARYQLVLIWGTIWIFLIFFFVRAAVAVYPITSQAVLRQ